MVTAGSNCGRIRVTVWIGTQHGQNCLARMPLLTNTCVQRCQVKFVEVRKTQHVDEHCRRSIQRRAPTHAVIMHEQSLQRCESFSASFSTFRKYEDQQTMQYKLLLFLRQNNNITHFELLRRTFCYELYCRLTWSGDAKCFVLFSLGGVQSGGRVKASGREHALGAPHGHLQAANHHAETVI